MKYTAENLSTQLTTLKDGETFSILMEKEMPLSAFGKKAKVSVIKQTLMNVCKGVDYKDRATTKMAVQYGKKLTGELPWGEWDEKLPYIINHNGKQYVRLYLQDGVKPKTSYFVNGKAVTKDELANEGFCNKSSLQPKSKVVDCMTVNVDNIVLVNG